MITVDTMAAVEMGIVVTSAGKCHSLVTFLSACATLPYGAPLIPVVDLEAPVGRRWQLRADHAGHGGHPDLHRCHRYNRPETLRRSLPRLIIDVTLPRTSRPGAQCHNVQSGLKPRMSPAEDRVTRR
jgi:hypothetical protein